MATMANHVLLRRITLSASASSVTFDSIPQTGYTDLKIVVSCATSRAADEDGLGVKLNSSTTGYTYRVLTGDGASAGSINTPYGQLWAARIQGANAGANIFSSTEIYIPNYAGSTAKSYSADSVTEKNGTNGYITMAALVQTSTAAISSIELSGLNANFVAGSSFSLYGIANAATTPALAPKADGGDIIKTDGTYWYHAFTGTGVFKPQLNLTCDVLVIAGGGSGGGGSGGAGGGGAGGYRSATGLSVSATNYTVTVGAGGASVGQNVNGNYGTDSTFSTITATGGGRGALEAFAGGNGGSGGGSSYTGTGAGLGNTPSTSPSQGNNGGNASTGASDYPGSGGGGAGAAGSGGSGSAGGAGGAGSNSLSSWATATGTGASGYFAGGGGGGTRASNQGGTGGSGGGGKGAGGNIAVQAGTANTGGGGGGGVDGGTPQNSGSGGSGIVIIRYPV